jgi:hypothetical protein
VLHINGRDIAVRARRVTDRTEVRASHSALEQKYGWQLLLLNQGEAPTPPKTSNLRTDASGALIAIAAALGG